MKEKPRKETHYGKEVWVNPATESLRRDECLCLNCAKMKPGQPDHCPIAQKFYEICVKENIALAVTRCSGWEAKGTTQGKCDEPGVLAGGRNPRHKLSNEKTFVLLPQSVLDRLAKTEQEFASATKELVKLLQELKERRRRNERKGES